MAEENTNNQVANTQVPATPTSQLPVNNTMPISTQEKALSGYQMDEIDDKLMASTVTDIDNYNVDPDTRKAIERASYDINSILPKIPDIGDGYPGNSSPNVNPFSDSSNIPDLTTPEGREAFISRKNEIANQSTSGTPAGYREPIIYGKRQMNADRYFRHPKFQDIGFHPFQDNETYYNQNSTWWDDMGRTMGAWGDMFGPAFTSSWRAIGDYFTGDGLETDLIGGESMRDAMRVGSSTRGGVGGFVNDLFLNSSYTAGIISSIFVEEVALGALTVASGGIASELAALRTAGNLKRLFTAGDKLNDVGRTATNYTQNFMQELGAIDKARDFYNFAKGNTYTARAGRWVMSGIAPETAYALGKINSTKNGVKNLSNLAKASKTFGGFYRDLRMINLAWSESKLEGGIQELDKREEYYIQALEENGGAELSKEEWDAINYLAKSTGWSTAWKNFPVIWLSNKLVLDGALRGFKPIGRMLDETMEGAGGRILRSKAGAEKAFFDAGTGLKGVWNAGWKNGVKGAGAMGLRYLTANFAEGFQELAQEAVAAGTGYYYDGLFDEVMSTSLDLNIASVESAKKSGNVKFKDAYAAAIHGEGVTFETFMSGFLMGGMVQPFQKILFEYMPEAYTYVTDKEKYDNYQKQKEGYIKNAVDALNELWADPRNYFDPTKIDGLTQKQLNIEMLAASYEGRIMNFKDAKDQAIFSKLYTMIDLGKANDFKKKFQAYLNMDNAELLEAFSDSEAGVDDIRKRLSGMLERLETMENNYNKFKDKFINPYDPGKFKYESQAWAQEAIRQRAYEQAKMMLMFSNNTYERSVQRMESILNKLAVDPVIDKLAANDIAALTDRNSMLQEMNILTEELKVEPEKNAPKEFKEQYKNKKEKLKLLKEYYDVFYSKENETAASEFDRRKIGKLRKAFNNYIDHLALTSGKNRGGVDKDKLNEALDMIIDHKALGGRMIDYFKASQVLNDSDMLIEVADRMSETMNRIWKENKKKYNVYKKVDSHIKKQERSKYLSSLAKKGIFADADQAKIFLESGVLPTDYYSEDSKINVVTAKENPAAWKIIQDEKTNHNLIVEADKKAKAEKVGEEAEIDKENIDKGSIDDDTTEEDLDSIAKGAGQSPVQVTTLDNLQKFLDKDPNTKEMLHVLHDEYKIRWADDKSTNKGPLITDINKFIKSEYGAPFARSRQKTYTIYERLSAAQKRDKTFDQWLSANQGLASIVKIVNSQGLDVVDILYDNVMNNKTKVKAELDTNEHQEYAMKIGIRLVRTDAYDKKRNKKDKYWEIRTFANDNAHDMHKGLDPEGKFLKDHYTDKTEADQAMKSLREKLQETTEFDFKTSENDTNTFKKGDIVEDKDGNTWQVASSKDNVEEYNNLKVVSTEGTGKVKYIDQENFDDAGWIVGSKIGAKKEDRKEINLPATKTTRLRMQEPLQFYAFNPEINGRKLYTDSEDARLELARQIMEMDPETIANFEIRIERSDSYETNVAGKETKDLDQFEAFEGYEVNTKIKRGGSKYNVVLWSGKEQIAVLQSPSDVILLDKNNNKINPLKITSEQAHQLFRTNKDDKAAEKLQRTYAAAYLLEEKFEDLINKSDDGVVKMKLADLMDEQKIGVKINKGIVAYPKNKSEMTKFNELEYNTIGTMKVDGVPTDIYYIIDQRVSELGAEERLAEADRITNFPQDEKWQQKKYKEFRAEVKEAADRADLRNNFGRYVLVIKTPDGEITFAEMKSESKSTSEISNIIQKIKDRVSLTKLDVNEGGNFKKEKGSQPERVDKKFNYKFNEELDNGSGEKDIFGFSNGLFISGKPGETIKLEVTEFGNLQVDYSRKFKTIVGGKNVEVKLDYDATIYPKDLEKIESNDVEGFVKLIQEKLDKKEAEAKKDHKGKVKFHETNLKLDASAFRNSVPKDATFKDLKDNTTVNIKPWIRYNQRMDLVVNDPAGIQRILDNAADPYDNIENEQQGEDDTTVFDLDTWYKKDFEKSLDNKFENVPEAVLEDIARKVNKKQELKKQEDIIFRSRANRRKVLNYVAALKQNDPEAEQIENQEGLTPPQTMNQQDVKDLDELKKEYKELWVQKFEKIKTTFPEETKGLRRKVLDEVAKDPQIIALKAKIDELEGSVLKVVKDDWDGRDIQDINVFINWAKQNLPDYISIEEIDNLQLKLKNNGITVGAFLMELRKVAGGEKFFGKIYTGNTSPYRYHEAFHAVFRLMLTETEIVKYLSLGKKGLMAQLKSEKKSLDKAIEEFKLQSPVYTDFTKEQAIERMSEEWMADRFEEFKINPKKTKVDPEIKSFFRRVLDFIISIFSKVTPKKWKENQIDKLFEKIDSGKFKTANRQTNRFTEALAETNGGIAAPVFAIIPKKTIVKKEKVRRAGQIIEIDTPVKIYFTSNESDKLTRNIAAAYWDLISQAKISKEKGIKPKDLLRKAVDLIVETQNPDRAEYNDNSPLEIFEQEEKYEALKNHKRQIRKGAREYLDLLQTKQEYETHVDEHDALETKEENGGEQWDDEANQQGGFKNLSTELRLFIATTSVKEQDRYGNDIIINPDAAPKDQLVLRTGVDYIQAYNSMLKSMAGAVDEVSMLKKMLLFGETSVNGAAVIKNFFVKLYGQNGYQDAMTKIMEEGKVPTPLDPIFYQKVIKGFSQFRVDYIFALRDKSSGKTTLFAANKKDDAHSQLALWGEAFDQLFQKLKPRIETNKKGQDVNIYSPYFTELQDVLDRLRSQMRKSAISDSLLKKTSKEIAADLERLTGISLSTAYVQYSILSTGKTDTVTPYQSSITDLFDENPITIEDLSELEQSLVRGENLFLDNQNAEELEALQEDIESKSEQEKPEGIKKRLGKWALANASFDETVGTTVFLDPKGNYIYAHQLPTYHLQKIAMMNKQGGLEQVMNNDATGYLAQNFLANDKRMQKLAELKKLKAIRMIGMKETTTTTTKDGTIIENKGLDSNNMPGVSYGEMRPNEFLANMINMYLLNYNPVTGKIDEIEYTNENGKPDYFSTSPILIRVLSESNTSDWIEAPVNKAVKTNKQTGDVDLTEDYLENWIAEVEKEYNIIIEETNKLLNPTANEDIIDGFNDANSLEEVNNKKNDLNQKKYRAYKLTQTAEVTTIRRTADKRVEVTADAVKKRLGSADFPLIAKEGATQKVFLKKGGITGMRENTRATVIINGIEYQVAHQGIVQRTDVDINAIIEDLGDSIQKDSDDVFKFEVIDNDNNTYYVKSKRLQEWFNGVKGNGNNILHRIKIQPIEDAQIERAELGEFEQEGNIFDNSLKRHLEKQARKGESFKNALASFKHESGITSKEFIEQSLLAQSDEFIKTVKKIKAEKLIDNRIKTQLSVNKKEGKADRGVNKETKTSMEALNLKANQLEFNLKQIFLSNWLNTKSINQLLLGNQAMKIKDPIDAIKRAKMQNAAGKSAKSIITAPSLGVKHTLSEIDMVVFNDPEIDSEFYTDKPGDAISQTDAQVYGTLKGFRYKWFGLGELTKQQANLIDRLEKGEQITAEEMYGAADKSSIGYKQLDAQLNSKKWVYGDGNIFIKMSETYLIPDDDSYIDVNTGVRVPYPHRIKQYNLRTKLEAWEKENNRVIMAVPKSASKMFNKNIAEHADIFESTSSINPRNVSVLNADYMRLQQVTPSNKTEIVDPRQIKNLILNEQDPTVEVTIGNKTITVGELKSLYHYSISNRVELKYLDRRNLIFDLDTALGEIDKSFNANEVSLDLKSFLDFAIAALESSQSKSQYLEFFSYDRITGQPNYELNNPITIQKMSELFMTFFSKGVLSEKQPGHNVVLMSDYGINVVKRVDARDKDGNPIAWTVVSTEGFKRMSPAEKSKLALDDEGNPVAKENADGKFSGLEIGDLYVDRLRYDVQEYKRNKDGKLIKDENNQLIPTDLVYAEFILPPHFRELMENLDPTKPIPDAVAKQFGVRIPSQDKHSAINLKIVDFMSAAKGSTAVFPRELIEVSGADFDIDKLYIQNKEFYTDAQGNFKEYGKGTTLNEQFADYIRYKTLEYQNDKGSSMAMAVKKWRSNKGILDDNKHEIEKPADLIFDEYLTWATKDKKSGLLSGTDPKNVKAKWAKENGYDYDSSKNENETGGFEPLYKDEIDIEETATDAEMMEFFGKNKHIAGALKVLRLPVTKDEYKKFRESNTQEYKYKDSKGKTQTGILYSEPYAGGYNNNILDYKFALLGNNGMTKVLPGRRLGIKNEPAVIDPLTDMWKKIQDRLPTLAAKAGEAGMDIDNMNGQTIAYTNVKEGARNIGSVVLPNVYLGWLKDFKTSLREKNDFVSLPIPRFNGHSYNTYDVDYIIDPKTGKQNKQGDRVQYWISSFITGMTDNGKHVLAGKMGLNKHALGVVANMVALGIDPYTGIMLINHPKIKEMYFAAMHKDKPTDPGIKGLVIARLRSLTNYSSEIAKEAKQVPVDDALLEEHIENYERVEEESRETGTRMPTDYIRNEIAILNQFLTMINISNQTKELSALANMFKGMGRDVDAVEATETSVAALGIEYTDREMNESELSIDVRKIFKPKKGVTMQSTFYGIWKQFTQKLLAKQVIYGSQPFKKLNSILSANMGALSPALATTARSKARKDLLSFIDGIAYIKLLQDVADPEALSSVRNSLIYPDMDGPVDIVEVITSLRDYLKKEGIKNDFINDFLFNDRANTAVNKAGINRAKVNSWTQLKDSQIQKLQAGLISLLDGDKKSRAAVTHLVNYLLVKDGFQFRAGSYLNIVPPVLLERFLQASSDVANLFAKQPPAKAGYKGLDQDYKNIFGMSFNDLAEFALLYFESSSSDHILQNLKRTNKDKTAVYVTVLQKKEYDFKGEVELKKNLRRNTIEEQSNKIFVISDNEAQQGSVGFSSLRNLPNVFAIPVKKNKGMDDSSYYTDSELEDNQNKINDAIEAIKQAGEETGATVVFNEEGVGAEDIYKLKEKAPKTYDFLQKRLLEEFGFKNPTVKKKAKPGTAANIPMDESNIKKIIKGEKTTTVRTEENAKKINIKEGESKLVEFKDPKTGKMVVYEVTNRGELNIEEAGGKEKMLKSEGFEKVADAKYNFTKDWLRDTTNELTLYVYDIKETDKKIIKVDTDVAASIEGVRSPGMSPVVLNLEDNTLIIDQAAGTRQSKIVYKEGKKQYRKWTKYDKKSKMWKNSKKIASAGFSAVEVDYEGQLQEIHKFHYAVKIEVPVKKRNDKGNLVDDGTEIKYYRLEKIFTPYTEGQYKAQKDMLNVDEVQSAAYGTRAEYVEFDPYGSKQQTPIAFIFNIGKDGKLERRTPYKTIREKQKQVSIKNNKFADLSKYKDNYTKDKLNKWLQDEKKKKLSDTDIDRIAATNEGLKAIKEDKIVGDTTVDEAEEIVNKNIKGKGLEEQAPKKVVLNFGKADNVKASTTKDDIGSKDVTQEDKFKLAQVWGDLTDIQKGKVISEMKLGGDRLKDLMNHYEDSNNQFNLEQFIEQMQKCYK
jgi:hypothetical protein